MKECGKIVDAVKKGDVKYRYVLTQDLVWVLSPVAKAQKKEAVRRGSFQFHGGSVDERGQLLYCKDRNINKLYSGVNEDVKTEEKFLVAFGGTAIKHLSA